jgi:hypothetical protein
LRAGRSREQYGIISDLAELSTIEDFDTFGIKGSYTMHGPLIEKA